MFSTRNSIYDPRGIQRDPKNRFFSKLWIFWFFSYKKIILGVLGTRKYPGAPKNWFWGLGKYEIMFYFSFMEKTFWLWSYVWSYRKPFLTAKSDWNTHVLICFLMERTFWLWSYVWSYRKPFLTAKSHWNTHVLICFHQNIFVLKHVFVFNLLLKHSLRKGLLTLKTNIFY